MNVNLVGQANNAEHGWERVTQPANNAPVQITSTASYALITHGVKTQAVNVCQAGGHSPTALRRTWFAMCHAFPARAQRRTSVHYAILGSSLKMDFASHVMRHVRTALVQALMSAQNAGKERLCQAQVVASAAM